MKKKEEIKLLIIEQTAYLNHKIQILTEKVKNIEIDNQRQDKDLLYIQSRIDILDKTVSFLFKEMQKN